jgi:hypothetical protein
MMFFSILLVGLFFFWENLQDVISLGLLDIACILASYLNSVCIDSICLDIIENFDYIGQSVFPVYAKVGYPLSSCDEKVHYPGLP